MLLSILAVIFTFGIVIFIHELGHFIVAKSIGVFVEEFSFGFGKAIFKKEKNKTLYAIRWIPLGGYVKMKGEDVNESKGDSDEYFAKKWYQRMLVVIAGPLMNYLLSFVIFFGIIYFVGKPVPSNSTVIGDVAQNYPAHISGLKAGDRILSINSNSVISWQDMTKHIYPNVEKEITMEYERDGKTYTIKVKTSRDPSTNRGIIGITPTTEYVKTTFMESVNYSFYQLWYLTRFTVTTLAGDIYHKRKPDVAGPIGIITIVSKAAHSTLADFFFLVGLISVAIGFFNILPLPLLDGGHIVLYLYEGIFKKKITPKMIKYVTSTGLALLLFIFIFATYSDIMRIYNAHIEKTRLKIENTVK